MDSGISNTLPRYCFRWNGELQIDGITDGTLITPTFSTTDSTVSSKTVNRTSSSSITTTSPNDSSSVSNINNSSNSNPGNGTGSTNSTDKMSITAPLTALFHNYGPIKLYPGKRVLTDVRIKRVPVAYVDKESIDANIELSANIENEERLYSGGIHLLRTLTCQHNRPGDDPTQPYLYIALEACDINLFDASEQSRKFSNFLLRNTIDSKDPKINNGANTKDNIMIPKLDHFEEDDAPLLLWRARRSVARQLLAGMTYLHRKGVFHGALKPTNVLIKNGIAKLAEISYYNLPGISPNNGNESTNPSTNPSPVLGPVNGSNKLTNNNNNNNLSSLASVANTALAALRSATMNEWCPAPNPNDAEEEIIIRNKLQSLPPHSPEIPPLNARLYALQSYRDTFAIGCLIYYVLTLGGHPFALRNNSTASTGGNTVLGSAAATSSMSSSLASVIVSPSIVSINNGNLGYPTNSGSNNNNVALRNILRKTTVDPTDVTAALARASLDAAAATAALALSLDAIENSQKNSARLAVNTATTNTDHATVNESKLNKTAASNAAEELEEDSVIDNMSSEVSSVTATPISPFPSLNHTSVKNTVSTVQYSDDDIVLPSSVDACTIPLDTPKANNSSDSEISKTFMEPVNTRSSASNLQISNKHTIPTIVNASSHSLLRVASFHDIVPAPIEDSVPLLLGSEPRASHSFASSGVIVPMQVGMPTPPGGPQKGITSGAWRSTAKNLLQQHHSQMNLTEMIGTADSNACNSALSKSTSSVPISSSSYRIGTEDDNIASIVITTPTMSTIITKNNTSTSTIPPITLPEATLSLVDPQSIIYVKNLPSSTTEKLLHDLFAPFGTVESIFMYNSIGTGKFRGTAKLRFTSSEHAKQALSLNGTDVKGNVILVELSREGGTTTAKVPVTGKVPPPSVPTNIKPAININSAAESDNKSTFFSISPLDDETPISTIPSSKPETTVDDNTLGTEASSKVRSIPPPDNATALRNRMYADRNVFHHVHYAKLSDTTDHVEAADMVCSLLRPEHNLRLTSSAALAHPVFWSATRKFLFITLISEGTVVQQTISKGRHAKLAASIQTAFLARLPPGCKEWSGLFPPPPGCGSQGWLNPLWPHRDPVSYEAVYAGPYSMYSLVRFVRNLYVHGQEHVRVGLFPSQQHLEAHVLSAFPWLVLELWKCDQQNGGRFTAQTLAGGTSRVVIGDTGIDAEYDISQSARTVRLMPDPGAAGERQISSNDLEALDDEASGKGVANKGTDPKTNVRSTTRPPRVHSDEEEDDSTNNRKRAGKVPPKHNNTLAAHLPPHIVAPSTSSTNDRGPGHRGGGGGASASNNNNNNNNGPNSSTASRTTTSQKQQLRKERLSKQQNVRLGNAEDKSMDRRNQTDDDRRSGTARFEKNNKSNNVSDAEEENGDKDNFDFYVGGDEDTNANPFNNLVDKNDDDDDDDDDNGGDIHFSGNNRYHYNNMDNHYRQRKNNRSRSRTSSVPAEDDNKDTNGNYNNGTGGKKGHK